MADKPSSESYSGWAIIELMGHRRIAGKVSEAVQYGAAMLRVDTPTSDDAFTTQFYGGSSIYCLTPTSEEVARQIAARNIPQPVQPWELKALPAHVASDGGPTDDDDEFEDRNDDRY